MNQSNVIFGVLFLAFVVFITMRGKLPAYLSALIGTSAAPAASSGGGSAASGASSAISAAVGNAASRAAGSAVQSIFGQ